MQLMPCVGGVGTDAVMVYMLGNLPRASLRWDFSRCPLVFIFLPLSSSSPFSLLNVGATFTRGRVASLPHSWHVFGPLLKA
jgi:hypothetical protein